jgi:hypothetical protein
MSIHLLQGDSIKDTALFRLLKKEGFHVEQKESQKISSNSNPNFVLRDTDVLSKFKGSEMQELCNEYYQIILLGSLTKFYWFFQFPCPNVRYVCR